MKKLFVLLLGVGFFATAAFADNDIPVRVNQLPDQAQQFVKAYFGDAKVLYAKMERGMMKSYEVKFANGGKAEFDSKGRWTEIEMPQSVVPADLVPVQLADYVVANYPGQKIVKLERNRMYWEADLDNGLELKFDKKFNLVDIDD